MFYNLKHEHKELLNLIRDFAQKEIIPTASERDEKEGFPLDVIKKMGGLGLLGMSFPEEYGGSGLDYTGFTLAIEEIAAADASIALTILAHTLCANHIYTFGSEEHKEKYLPPLLRGETLGAWALTEPAGGSNVGSIRTTARKSGDKWIISGQKLFITNASYADTFVIMAKTDEALGKKGFSAFVVKKGVKGLKTERILKKLGVRSSDTAVISFDNVEIPEDSLIGELNRGFEQVMEVLDSGRIGIASMAVGIAGASIESAMRYAKEREQFGRPIAEFEAIKFMLADMATEIEAGRLLTQRAAILKEEGKKFTKEASMAKLFSSEMAVRCATKAIQIHGGYGYIKEYSVERYFRDARVCEIGEGTSEVQRLIIARELLKD